MGRVCAVITCTLQTESRDFTLEMKGITFAHIHQQNLKFDFYNLILEKGQQLVLEDDLTFTLMFWVKQPQMVTLGNDVNMCA